jgi:hypothetical protein
MRMTQQLEHSTATTDRGTETDPIKMWSQYIKVMCERTLFRSDHWHTLIESIGNIFERHFPSITSGNCKEYTINAL